MLSPPPTSLEDLSLEDWSSIAGWTSIACWIVVYSPQIWENYQLQSGEGLSVAFVVLWLVGDLTNLAGGAMAHLLPTMIILAVYYSLCDFILLLQVYYYRRKHARKALESPPDEAAPLLVKPTTPPPAPLIPAWIQYPLLTVLIILAGFSAWYIQNVWAPGRSNHGAGGPVPPRHKAHELVALMTRSRNPSVPVGDAPAPVELEWKSQLLGYTSAVTYLGSRVPQIAHNIKTRCAGLSLAMFFFSISGNVTYVASICFKSMERTYLIANASWLAGSGLTIFLDIFVLGQFAYYNWQDGKTAESEGGGREVEA